MLWLQQSYGTEPLYHILNESSYMNLLYCLSEFLVIVLNKQKSRLCVTTCHGINSHLVTAFCTTECKKITKQILGVMCRKMKWMYKVTLRFFTPWNAHFFSLEFCTNPLTHGFYVQALMNGTLAINSDM